MAEPRRDGATWCTALLAAVSWMVACSTAPPPSPPVTPAETVVSTGPAAAAPAPTATSSGCLKSAPHKDAAELHAADSFATHLAAALTKLEPGNMAAEDELMVAQLKLLDVLPTGACGRVGVTLVPAGGSAQDATVEVALTSPHPLELRLTGKLEWSRRGEPPPPAAWGLRERVERSVGRALMTVGIASALKATPTVEESSALKLSADFAWGRARTADHSSQCIWSIDGSRSWCWHRRKDAAAGVTMRGWRKEGAGVRGFIAPDKGQLWAVMLPEGTYATAASDSVWPQGGFKALPNEDSPDDLRLLAIAHERRKDGAFFDTAAGPIRCRQAQDRVTCEVAPEGAAAP